MQGSTYFGLLAEFGAAEIPLEDLADKYFGLDKKTAYSRAALNKLPVPTYRCGSQKSGRLVSAGSHLIQHQLAHNGIDLNAGLQPLSIIDTHRTAPCWNGTCLVNGRLCKTAAGINSTAVVLCKTLGIGVPVELKKWEVV
ncbi:MAG: pyocin activator PrtN family protein [Marinobacterium sp.]|nr:pyocin activator PrtN family protein [Marinobacterium sp.]